jgi:predicted nucleic acid-binding protein
MILVDSSVWIAFFRGDDLTQVQWLQTVLREESTDIVVADMVLLEVLQGFRSDIQAKAALNAMTALPCFNLGGKTLALLAAKNYRKLRSHGCTVRSTLDCLIATFCIEHGFTLLHNDRDFVPFQQHLGLRTVESV